MKTVVVGAGRMGRNIAQTFAYAGYPIELLDIKPRRAVASERLLTEALGEIRDNLEILSRLGKLDEALIPNILNRITPQSGDEALYAMTNAHLVFEAVPETIKAKTTALRLVSQLVTEEAIISSTTSTILVDTLADMVQAPERFINGHWLNPAYLIPLVEVSPGTKTSPETTSEFRQVLSAVGKVTVLCAASPGFIVPRIQSVAMNEAARMVEEGVATPEDIDKAIRYGFGPRYAAMGMIQFIDWGGSEILYHASNYLAEALGSDRYAPPKIVKRMTEDGTTGLNAGEGFYDYRTMDVNSYRLEIMKRFLDLLEMMDMLPVPSKEDKTG